MLEHSPILSAVQRHAVEATQAVALVSATKERVTYADLFGRIVQAAAFLRERGLRKGDRIALSAQTELDFIYVYFAAHLLDVVNVVVFICTKIFPYSCRNTIITISVKEIHHI